MTPEVARRSIAALEHHTPTYWYDFLNLSSAFFVLGHTNIALFGASQAIRLERNSATLVNLAVMLEAKSEFHRAFPLAEEAYALNPSDNFAAILYSDALFRMGRYSEAWSLYAHSHTNWGWLSKIIPEWDGKSSISGKRILVLSGGGYGDNIFHLRWIPYLKGLGAHVTFMCPKSMHSLLAGKYGFDTLIAGSVAGLEGTIIPADHDLYTCVLSLGGYFPSISDVPYLAERASPRGKIGLCTQAGEEKIPRRNRSLTDDQMHRIAESIPIPKCQLLNPTTCPFKDWLETALFVTSLELLITVDTAIAHLAGALNIPTWVILPGNSALYYGVSGSRSPWYPSQRLFRNGGEGIDNSVNAVCEALKELK